MLTAQEREARIEALNEAASHLEHHGWSDDSEELKQGDEIAAQLRRQIDRLVESASERRQQ